MTLLAKYLRGVYQAPDAPAPGGGAAPAAAPAAAPSSTPSTPDVSPSPAPSGDSVVADGVTSSPGSAFEGMGGFDDGDTIEIEVAPAVAPAAPVAVVPAVTPPVPAQPAVPAVAAPPAQPAAPPAQAAQPPASPAQSAEPQNLVQQLGQHRDAIIGALAADRFKLTKEELDGLELDAANTVPRLLAKAYYESQQSTLLHIQNFVPQMVVSMVKAMNDQKSAEDAFYGAHKHLDRTKHSADVNNFARAFRQQNPQLPQNDLLAMVAAAVSAKFGVMPGAQPSAPAAPTQPAVPAFVPARPGAAVSISPEPENPFAGLGQNFDD